MCAEHFRIERDFLGDVGHLWLELAKECNCRWVSTINIELKIEPHNCELRTKPTHLAVEVSQCKNASLYICLCYFLFYARSH